MVRHREPNPLGGGKDFLSASEQLLDRNEAAGEHGWFVYQSVLAVVLCREEVLLVEVLDPDVSSTLRLGLPQRR